MDELNQATDGMFDDFTEDDLVIENEPEESESEEPKAETEETTEVKAEEPFLTIRYNKEDKGLTREDAITYAQKGMNYDHLNDKYTNLSNRLSELAGMNGMQLDAYLDSLSNAQKNLAISKEMKSLRQAYPGAEDALIREIAERNVNERFVNQQTKLAEEAKTQEETQRKELEKQIDIFQSVFPNVRADNLDQKVYDLMGKGYTLLEAYYVVNKPKEDARNAIIEKNTSNKAKSLGNVGNAEEVSTDDFLAGWND